MSATDARPRVPPGTRVYAVGDVHGRLDLLDELQARIASDSAAAGARRTVLVYLGDYIDRGPDSAGVIGRLLAGGPPADRVVALLGNHEHTLLRFLDDATVGFDWFEYGGIDTLASYGVELGPARLAAGERLERARDRLRARLPASHREFLSGLPLHHAEGDYLFVHAGVRPGVPLARQRADDLLWIRGEFLRSDADHGHVVVHGHSIAARPERRPNRIGIDTGAFATGVLTCLVLEDDRVGFLRTGEAKIW